jgi:hypothetical protein
LQHGEEKSAQALEVVDAVFEPAQSLGEIVQPPRRMRTCYRSEGKVKISAIRTFQKVVKATDAIPPVPKRL